MLIYNTQQPFCLNDSTSQKVVYGWKHLGILIVQSTVSNKYLLIFEHLCFVSSHKDIYAGRWQRYIISSFKWLNIVALYACLPVQYLEDEWRFLWTFAHV